MQNVLISPSCKKVSNMKGNPKERVKAHFSMNHEDRFRVVVAQTL